MKQEFLDAYIEAALWSSNDLSSEEAEFLDENYDSDDLSEKCLEEFKKDCISFCEDNAADLEGLDPGQCGHDFWLTRNRHGAGFWDRGLGEKGERLSKAAHVYGSVDLYVNDGKIHCN